MSQTSLLTNWLNVAVGVGLYWKTARRSARTYGLKPWRSMGALRADPIFVVGSPRSGTSFTAGAIGQVSGFHDMGEVPRFKAAIPALYEAKVRGRSDEAVRRLRRMIRRSQRVAMAKGRRAIEQTPEATFLIAELAEAFPQAQFVHLVRDGRDVVASLIDRGWLAGPDDTAGTVSGGSDTASSGFPPEVSVRWLGGGGCSGRPTGGPTDGESAIDSGSAVVDSEGKPRDDAGQPYGSYRRFWLEPGDGSRFAGATEATRCAWAWRRYESTAKAQLAELDPERVIEIRYEDLARDSHGVASRVAGELQATDQASEFVRAFSRMHPNSVGRYLNVLSESQQRDVADQADTLLAELGY